MDLILCSLQITRLPAGHIPQSFPPSTSASLYLSCLCEQIVLHLQSIGSLGFIHCLIDCKFPHHGINTVLVVVLLLLFVHVSC